MREGFAAQAVVQSCMMAKLGMHTRFDTPIEGKMGFYTMYTRGNCDLTRITDGLGKRFETDNITYKPWPSCKATHTPIQVLTDIMAKEDLKAEDIKEIHLKLHESAAMALEPFEYKLQPESVAMAKVSMPFVLGTILKYGSLDLGSFTEERLADPDIREQGRKISFEYESSWGKPQAHFADMTVKSSKGEFFRHEESSMGGTGHPLTDAQVKDKFFSCVKFYRMLKDDAQIEKLYEASMNTASLKNVGELIGLL